MQNKSQFQTFLSNETDVGANRKFITLTRNGLKAIDANQSNHVK